MRIGTGWERADGGSTATLGLAEGVGEAAVGDPEGEADGDVEEAAVGDGEGDEVPVAPRPTVKYTSSRTPTEKTSTATRRRIQTRRCSLRRSSADILA
jgi:hypothetical protein